MSAEDDLGRLLDRLALKRETHLTLRPRYDEIVVGVVEHSDALATVVFRATRRGVLRVAQIARSGDKGWTLRSCDEVPVDTHAGYQAPDRLDYADRTYLASSE